MSRVAFLGLGAMGSRMAGRLLAVGHEVVVWNRTAGRTGALADLGAAVAATPRQAAKDAQAVFAMVRDDDASRSAWLDAADGALAGMRPEAVAVDCSTLSVGHVRELAGAFRAAGRDFLDAPVAGSRPQAEAGQLIFLAGGPEAALARVRPLLDAMGSAVHHAGGNAAGAAVKLMVNALFGIQLASLAELIGFARRTGIDPGRAMEILAATPVCSPAAGAAAAAMLAGRFAPAFPIELAAKDFALVEQSAQAVGAALPVADAARVVYQACIAQGHGADNITGVVQLYDRQRPPGTGTFGDAAASGTA